MSSKEMVGKAIKQMFFATIIILVIVTFLIFFHKGSIKNFSAEKEPGLNSFNIFPYNLPFIPIITSD